MQLFGSACVPFFVWEKYLPISKCLRLFQNLRIYWIVSQEVCHSLILYLFKTQCNTISIKSFVYFSFIKCFSYCVLSKVTIALSLVPPFWGISFWYLLPLRNPFTHILSWHVPWMGPSWKLNVIYSQPQHQKGPYFANCSYWQLKCTISPSVAHLSPVGWGSGLVTSRPGGRAYQIRVPSLRPPTGWPLLCGITAVAKKLPTCCHNTIFYGICKVICIEELARNMSLSQQQQRKNEASL